MRLAVLSDIHGNLHALEAVLADLEAAGGADLTWVIGDLVAFGPDPRGCLAALRALPEETTKVIQGNTDRYVTTWARPHAENPTADNWADYVAMMKQRDANFAWTSEQISGPEAEYLLKLGTDLHTSVPGYGCVIGFHAGPGDYEMVLLPYTADDVILDALLDREGRLAFGGHTHKPMDRVMETWRFVNPGSVGLPFDGDQRASYALVTFEGQTASVDIRRVAYDVAAAIAALDACSNPARDFAIDRLRTAGAPH